MFVLVLSAAAVLTAGLTVPFLREANLSAASQRITPIADPTNLRRLEFDDFQYMGAFRLPAEEANGDSFSIGGSPMTYNPYNGSLFVGARSGRVAEVRIPAPSRATNINALPFAQYLQPFADPAEGGLKEIATDGVSLAGLLVHGDRLYGSGVIYYDANNTQTLSHFSRPLRLAERGAGGLRRIGQRGRTGFVAGYMAVVPPEWQTRLGGAAITGQCCIPIVTRTSWGPAAFAWNPDELYDKGNVKVKPLVYYDSGNHTLGPWDGSNPTYGGTIQMGGVAVIGGTRTAVFVGRNGTGPFCYGTGTADKALVGKAGSDGEKYCYDPVSSAKAQHAYPYRYQMWAYDLSEWAAVSAGKKDPWDVKPYGVWPFDFPFPEPGTRIAGVAYDVAGQRLFVSQYEADRDGYSYRPLIHVYRIQ